EFSSIMTHHPFLPKSLNQFYFKEPRSVIVLLVSILVAGAVGGGFYVSDLRERLAHAEAEGTQLQRLSQQITPNVTGEQPISDKNGILEHLDDSTLGINGYLAQAQAASDIGQLKTLLREKVQPEVDNITTLTGKLRALDKDLLHQLCNVKKSMSPGS